MCTGHVRPDSHPAVRARRQTRSTSLALAREVCQVASLPMGFELSGTLLAVDDGLAGTLPDHGLQFVVRGQFDHSEDIELKLGSLPGDVGQGRPRATLAHLFTVFCVMVDVANWICHPVTHNVAGETPLALGDPDPSIDCPARFGVGDEPLPMLRHTPVAHSPRMVAMTHSIPLDAAAVDFDPSAHPSGLFDPIHREPRRQAVGIAVVAERVVNAAEREFYSHAIAVVGHPARFAQLRLRKGEAAE